MADSEGTRTEEREPIRELSRIERRILGTLLEKGFTTPESYPLTLKALTTGCNQKSNRDPATNYSEDEVLETLDRLREQDLVHVLFTESGRTERYRHYVRHRLPMTEPQLAILTELLLRGRQSLGDLRARASRMVPVETLEDLRREIAGLCERRLVRAFGPLEMRGVEVDHGLYPASERGARSDAAHVAAPVRASSPSTVEAVAHPVSSFAGTTGTPESSLPTHTRVDPGGARLAEVLVALQSLQSQHEDLLARVDRLESQLSDLKQALGA